MDNLLPPGYRFYPTEEELVSFYLHDKLENTRDDLNRVIPILDIYNFDPSDLPHYAGDLCHGDPEQWFFFIPRQEREERGGRPKRLTDSGYWKATGSPGYVYSSNHRIIGEKRTMVFYEGRAPNGTKTEWKMNEYKAIDGEALSSTNTCPPVPLKLRQEFSVNRVYKTSKSLTAFDRRPLTVVNRPAILQDDHQTTTASARILMQERTPSSLYSSSSGDHHHHHNHCLPQPQTVEAHCGSSIMGMHQATEASPIISMQERTTSFDTLSSGDHHHHHHNHCHSQSQTVEAHAGSSTMGMHAIDDTDELDELDWVHFDWDYDMY